MKSSSRALEVPALEIKAIIDTEEILRKNGLPKNRSDLLAIKKMGFSDARLAELTSITEPHINSLRNIRLIFLKQIKYTHNSDDRYS